MLLPDYTTCLSIFLTSQSLSHFSSLFFPHHFFVFSSFLSSLFKTFIFSWPFHFASPFSLHFGLRFPLQRQSIPVSSSLSYSFLITIFLSSFPDSLTAVPVSFPLRPFFSRFLYTSPLFLFIKSAETFLFITPSLAPLISCLLPLCFHPQLSPLPSLPIPFLPCFFPSPLSTSHPRPRGGTALLARYLARKRAVNVLAHSFVCACACFGV